MSRYIKIATTAQIREGRSLLVSIEGDEVVLIQVEGQLYGIRNICAHQHIPKLHEGVINGHEVTCPMHGWKYDIRTGKSPTGQGTVQTFPIKVAGVNVFIELEDDC